MSEKNDAHTLPEVTFSTFILSLASSAMVHLGEVPNPETGIQSPNEELARNTIDVLTMLEDKIKHGLTEKEEQLLRDVLYELRVKFITHS